MDSGRFDATARRLAGLTRRDALRGLAAFAAGLGPVFDGLVAPRRRRNGRGRCGNRCVNTQTDPKNCGRCGNACSGGDACSTGLCCPQGQTNCDGTCKATCDSAAANRPFPQRLRYPGAAVYPSRSRDDQDADVRAAYQKWKQRYVVAAGKDGEGHPLYRIAFGKPGGNAHKVTVSEGQGYGMVILAHMAGEDPQAQTTFDGLWRFAQAHPSRVAPHELMAWKVPTAPDDRDSAFDGDNDMAYALLLAEAQWGNGGPIKYRTEFNTLIGAIEAKTIGPQSRLPLLGDWVDANGGKYNQHTPRTSDFTIGHFRAYGRAVGGNAWGQVVTNCQTTIGKLQRDDSPATGLLPDFVQAESTSPFVPRPADPNFLEGPTDGAYSYNAGRTPWRIGTDALLNNDATSKSQAKKMSDWIVRKTGGKPDQIKAGYKLDGTQVRGSNYFTTFFAAPFGVAAMLDPDRQTWLDAVYEAVRSRQEDYYEDSVTLLCLLVMTGNFWDPTA